MRQVVPNIVTHVQLYAMHVYDIFMLYQSVLVSQLWKRYQKRLIYTYVGNILISINPFQKLDIYNDKVSMCLSIWPRVYCATYI